MLELYTHPMSPCAQKVRIVLAEKGLDWEKRHVETGGEGEPQTGISQTESPGRGADAGGLMGKPVIESSPSSASTWRTNLPDSGLRPDNPWHTSQMRFWMKHVDIKVHPSCGALQWPLLMADKLRQLSEAEMDAIIDKVVEKPPARTPAAPGEDGL